jgi:hypothetical protein
MWVFWRCKINILEQIEVASKEEAIKYKFQKYPEGAVKRVAQIEGEEKWLVELIGLQKIKTEGACTPENKKIIQQQGFMIEDLYDMKNNIMGRVTESAFNFPLDEIGIIQKVMMNETTVCKKCYVTRKMNIDRANARIRKESKQRAVEAGDPTGEIAPIKDEDMKGYMKYLVEQKIQEENREKQKQAQQMQQRPFPKVESDEEKKLRVIGGEEKQIQPVVPVEVLTETQIRETIHGFIERSKEQTLLTEKPFIEGYWHWFQIHPEARAFIASHKDDSLLKQFDEAVTIMQNRLNEQREAVTGQSQEKKEAVKEIEDALNEEKKE